jgi:hypothetical protein
MSWPQTIATTEDTATNFGIDLRAFLTIVGIEEETLVNVTLSSEAVVLGGAQPLDTLTYTIGPFDVINLETDGFNADFTSTFIEANKPIAVFSGSEASDAPFFETIALRDCCADHLEEQLFPLSAAGSQFIAVHTPLRTKYVEQAGWNVALADEELEYFRIMATNEDTSVTTSLPPPWDYLLLGRGQYATIPAERDFTVQAARPIQVAQYSASAQSTGIPPLVDGEVPPGGDPSFIMVPPLQQWRDKYVFLVPNKYVFDFIMLAIPIDATILIDGERLDDYFGAGRCEYDSVGTLADGDQQTEYVAVRCPLSDPDAADPTDPARQDDGRHYLESLDGHPFGLTVFGWDDDVSYGYPGGTNISQINPQ